MLKEETIPLIQILSEMTRWSIEEILEYLQKASIETEEIKTPFGTFVIIKHKKSKEQMND